MQKILKNIFQSAWFYYAVFAAVLYFSVTPKVSYYQRLNNLIDYSNYPVYHALDHAQSAHPNVLKMRKAIRYYKLLIKLHPQLARAYAMVGYGYDALGNYELAARYYLKAAEIRPDYPWFYYDLGIIYSRLGDPDKAVLYLNKALSGEPANMFSVLVEHPGMLKDKAEVFNKVSFLRSMQTYAKARDLVAEIKNDPANTRITDDLILDPMAYLFPIGQENL